MGLGAIEGRLITHKDWYWFANVITNPKEPLSISSGEDIAGWLSQFPDGSRVRIAVDPHHS